MIRYLVGLYFLVGVAHADPIPSVFVDVARSAGIPPDLFYATILTESRARVRVNGKIKHVPWPWTLNVNGQPRRFQTRQAAYDFLKGAMAQGIRQVGIGYGQHEWRWHKHRYSSLWAALDPYINLQVTAQIFREIYDSDIPHCRKSWINTIGCYHRMRDTQADRIIALRYTIRVLEQWKTI